MTPADLEWLQGLTPQHSAFWLILVEVITGLVLIGVATLLVANHINRPAKAAPQTSLSSRLKYTGMHDSSTIEINDRSAFFRIITIDPIDLDGRSNDLRRLSALSRKRCDEALTKVGLTYRWYLEKQEIQTKPLEPPPHPVFARMFLAHQRTLESASKLYWSLAVEAPTTELLDQAEQIVSSHLGEYNPKPAANDAASPDNGPLAILARLASPVTQPRPVFDPETGITPGQAIDADRLNLATRKLAENGSERLYFEILSISNFSTQTAEKMAIDLMSIAGQYTVTFVRQPIVQLAAKVGIENELSRAEFMPGADGLEDTRQLLMRLGGIKIEPEDRNPKLLTDTATRDQQTIGFSQIIICPYAKSRRKLRVLVSQIAQSLTANGATVIIETTGPREKAFMNQFPGRNDLLRKFRLTSSNVATLVPLHNAEQNFENSPWGGPVLYYPTVYGSPYPFHFHARNDQQDPLANIAIIGPSRAGKTTLMSNAAASAMRFPNFRFVGFDRFFGMEIPITAMGGEYTRFDDVKDGWNPLQLEDAPANRDFLKRWISALAQTEDPKHLQEIAFAVDTLYAMLPNPLDRSLNQLVRSTLPVSSPVGLALRPFTGDGQYAAYINASKCPLRFTARATGIDCTNFMEDPKLAPMLGAYFMHALIETIKKYGGNFFLFIDETEYMQKDQYFDSRVIRPLLQQIGKMGSGVGLCYQRAQALEDTNISSVVMGQCSSQIFFRHPEAQRAHYPGIDFTESEWDFIKGHNHNNDNLRYAFLLKRPAEMRSIILNGDLRAMGRDLIFLSSSQHHVRRAKELRETHGHNWLEHM